MVDALLEQIKALVEQNTTLLARIAELEARNGQPPQGPPKTPSNSSLPPSSGQKANRPETRKKGRKGRIGGRAEDVDLQRRAIHARTPRTIAMRSMIVGCRCCPNLGLSVLNCESLK